MQVFSLFGGWCDCLSLSDPYQSWCVQDTIDPMCRDRHTNHIHWTRRLEHAKHHLKHAQKPWKCRQLCGDGNICVDPRWPQAWISMSHIVGFKRWCSPLLTAPLSVFWQYGLCTSKVPWWIRRFSVFLFQGWNRIMNASNAWRTYQLGDDWEAVSPSLPGAARRLIYVMWLTVIRESELQN